MQQQVDSHNSMKRPGAERLMSFPLPARVNDRMEAAKPWRQLNRPKSKPGLCLIPVRKIVSVLTLPHGCCLSLLKAMNSNGVHLQPDISNVHLQCWPLVALVGLLEAVHS